MKKNTKNKLRLIAAALVLIAAVIFGQELDSQSGSNPVSPPISAGSSSDSSTQIHFINVGQGDCTLITNGDHAVLIDGGKQSSSSTVVDYLSRLGIAQLDAVIATHPHEDHIGGLPTVLNTFPVETIYLSDEATDTRIYEKLLDAIEDNDITAKFPEIGETIPISDDLIFTVLAPGANSAETYSDDPNDWSLVMRLDSNGCSALFTGDTTAAVEQDMVKNMFELLRCDILKVAHHGSRTSSSAAFIEACAPQFAVISYAEGNSYGLPDEEIFELLEPYDTKIYETAKDGTIVLTLQNGEVTAA